LKVKTLNKNIPLSAKIFVGLIVLLLLFDRNFSKINISGGIYLHDYY